VAVGESSAQFHEAQDVLRQETQERHRAIVSLMEELEAVDWYDQRVDGTTDDSLRAILAHNRDEEKEHAAMTLEWLRRHDPTWDRMLRTYLFTDVPITEVEAEAEAGDTAEPPAVPRPTNSLGIGSLSDKETL
jgi:ferritin-like protein